MNGYSHERELPELSNDQIETLYQICLGAAKSAYPPFKALFVEYDAFVADSGLDPGHEAALFRWICAVGDSTRKQHAAGERVDLVYGLRTILAAQGVETIIDNEDEGEDTRSLRVSNTPPKKEESKSLRRRVSFGDAQVEETWLSEHSGFMQPQPSPEHQRHLNQPPRRGRNAVTTRRARSTSSSQRLQSRHPAPKRYHEGSSYSYRSSDHEEQQNATLVFEVSQTQLEENADAFYETTALRGVRHYLHTWYGQTLALRSSRASAWAFAENHDRRKLLKESLDTLIAVCDERRQERERLLVAKRLELEAQHREEERIEKLNSIIDTRLNNYRKDVLFKVLSHWREELVYQREQQDKAKTRILKFRYFTRWKRLTLDNAEKVRSILSQKYLRIWRGNTARCQLIYEQAEAHHEEFLTKRCWKSWFWKLHSRRVDIWRDQRLQRRSFDAWVGRLQGIWTGEDKALLFRGDRSVESALRTLRQRRDELQQASQTAESLYRRTLAKRCFKLIGIKAKLKPQEKTVSVRIELDLKKKAFKVWHMHLCLTRQANEADRNRILQSAWTSWNDALRSKAMSQRVDERVLVESLYKWVLQTRLKAYRRSKGQTLLRDSISGWQRQVASKNAALRRATTSFESSQRWRTMRFGMTRLNLALRKREDAARAATEFSNSRAVPNVLDMWKQRTEHARMLAKWAADARFYCAATRTVKLWRERTEEHKHRRRRDAYAQVRTRVKLRIIGSCFDRLRARSGEVRNLRAEAAQSAQARLFKIGIGAFDAMRRKAELYAELNVQAIAMDHQKLLSSALSALINEHTHLGALGQRSSLFRQETDLALLAGALKRIQWATFTAARRTESADALWARNRDQHLKNMLRHWASQSSAHRAAKGGQRFNESPSLGPANRVAARSAEKQIFASPPPITAAAAATPGYMRTPSRSRRAPRFKPLPTPAHITPFAFDRSYMATTPAPLAGALAVEDGVEAGEMFEGLAAQITPFAKKLRASGITTAPPSAFKSSVFGRSMTAGGTSKSVRFAGAKRFGGGRARLSPADEVA